jgi:hypothetical protein
MKKSILLLAMPVVLAATASRPLVAGPGHDYRAMHQLLEQEKQSVNIYKVYFPNVELARKAAITFHGQLLESHYDAGYLIFELNAEDMEKLRRFGFRFEYASDFVYQRNLILGQLQARQMQELSRVQQQGVQPANVTTQSIPNYTCYETVEETFAAAQGFVSTKPNLASWIDVGDSWEKTQSAANGYDIWVLKLTNNAVTGSKPKLFINAAIHAREYTTAPLVLEFARWLVNGHGTNADATWILDHHEVHLMLQTNPDGRKRAEGGLSWRKNTNNNFCANTNTRGVDLNRNFSFSWNATNGQGSSGNQCDLTYRGPSAGSEPETKAIEAYVRSLWPDRRGPGLNDAAPADTSGIHLDIHSYSRLVLWPWGTTNSPAPNGTALQTLGRKFAFFNGYTPQQSIGLYPTDGTSDGVSYGELGVAAYTFELGTAFFESCTNYNNTIKPGNLPALIYAAKVVRTPYITPAGPDVTALSLSNDASGAGVLAGTPVTLSATVSDARFNNSNGTEATQSINAAEYYIDVPPWQSGAVAVPLSAGDGAFNAVTENATGSINTSALSLGKHIVYVRSRDASGSWGAVSAVFLNITNIVPPSGNFAEVEPNNSTSAAQVIVNANTTVNGTMSAASDNDYYRVSLPAGATLSATLTPNSSSDYDLFLYNSAGSIVARSERGTGLVDTASVTNSGAGAATYYARVRYYSGGTGATNGKYTLKLAW